MKSVLIIVILISFVFAQPALATVMSSSNYRLQSDSVNFGGGNSSSTSYVSESTFGEIATGNSGSTNFNIKAGYQQMQEVYLAISTVADVTLTPSINGNSGGIANGSTLVTVLTDNPAGYELYVSASSSPALISGVNSFADYTPVGVVPDFTFTVASTTAEFGFSPEGTAIVSNYKDNGTVCGSGVLDTVDSCWSNLTTSNVLIAKEVVPNFPAGTGTTLKFRVESGIANIQPAGAYSATSTVTAVAL